MRIKLLSAMLLIAMTASAAVYEISRETIRSQNFRTVYDILAKIPVLYGTSFGHTGQTVNFSLNGQRNTSGIIYIDSVITDYTTFENFDFSDLSVERIRKIVIDDNSIQSNGLRIDIITDSKYGVQKHESEVFYNDAYFNHRDLAVSLKQNFTANSSFQIFSQITDYHDNREYEDQYLRLPYEKQDYTAKINIPDYWLHKTSFEGGFFRKKVTDLLYDSLKYDEEKYFITTKAAIPFSIKGFSNQMTASWQKKASSRLTLSNYDSYILAADFDWTIEQFMITHSNSLTYRDFVYGHQETVLSDNLELSWHIDSLFKISNRNYLEYNDSEYQSGAASLICETLLPAGFGFDAETVYHNSTGIFQYTKTTTEKLTSDFIIKHTNSGSTWKNSTSASIKIINDLLPNAEALPPQFSLAFQHDWKNLFIFSVRYNKLLDPAVTLTNYTDYALISDLNYRQHFYNNQLTVNINLSHHYSRYFPGFSDNHAEFMNNLGFKASAKILDCEIFYGIDNFLKKNYSVENRDLEINPHYFYQTIPGYDMPKKDEIWGIRWTFYN